MFLKFIGKTLPKREIYADTLSISSFEILRNYQHLITLAKKTFLEYVKHT